MQVTIFYARTAILVGRALHRENRERARAPYRGAPPLNGIVALPWATQKTVNVARFPEANLYLASLSGPWVITT